MRPMTAIETERLILRRLSYDDTAFIVELVNEPAFRRYIGDKNVRNAADARAYLRDGPIGSYERFGFGLFLAMPKETGASAGICGLVKRDAFDDPDLGFAFLERYCGRGFAFEASRAVLDYGFDSLGLERIIAMADPDNERSVRLLAKLGMQFERKVRMSGDAYDIDLFALQK